jgi:phosphate transport system protein
MLREPEYILDINKKILDMQEIVERSADIVISGMERRPENLQSILTDLCKEEQINEELVVEMSVEALIRFQPFASDLRAITVAMKVAYDLSRVCRYYRNISEILDEFNIESPVDPELIELAKEAREMIKQALTAYFSKDAKLASRIIKSDNDIDTKYRDVLKKYATQNGLPGNLILSAGLTARIIERMADHAVYLSTETVYLVTGRRTDYR